MNKTQTRQVLDALKLLDPSLKFENWENGEGIQIQAQLSTAAALCEASLARVDEPVAWMDVFDIAVGEELAHVSHVPYDSHESCMHFAGLVRNRIAEATPQEAVSQPGQAGELSKYPVALSRDDTEHGVYYYKASEVDAIIAAINAKGAQS